MNKNKQYYGVAAGKQCGVFTSWSQCNKQVQGITDNCYQGFNSIEECISFLLERGSFESESDIKVYSGKHSVALADYKASLSQHPENTVNDGNQPPSDSSNTQSPVIISNCVIAFIAGYLHQRPKEQIKTAVMSHFSKEEIIKAKCLLWDKCDHLNVLDKIVHRLDTSVRCAEDASMDDILTGLRYCASTKVRTRRVIGTFYVTAIACIGGSNEAITYVTRFKCCAYNSGR